MLEKLEEIINKQHPESLMIKLAELQPSDVLKVIKSVLMLSILILLSFGAGGAQSGSAL